MILAIAEEIDWAASIAFGPYGGAYAFGLLCGVAITVKILFEYVIKYQRNKNEELSREIQRLNEKILDIVRQDH